MHKTWLHKLLLQLFCLKLPKWEMSKQLILFDYSRVPESLGKQINWSWRLINIDYAIADHYSSDESEKASLDFDILDQFAASDITDN